MDRESTLTKVFLRVQKRFHACGHRATARRRAASRFRVQSLLERAFRDVALDEGMFFHNTVDDDVGQPIFFW
jgi:hypothetical protein